MLLKILIWIVSIFVGLFSILLGLSFMAGRRENNAGPRLDGPGPQDKEEQVPAGPAFEIPTMNHFIKAAMSGNMPGNVKSQLPLFPASDMTYFSTPYKEWAPKPFSDIPLPTTAGPFGNLPLGGKSPAPIIRLMHIMSGFADIFEMAMTQTMPTRLDRSFKSMKSKIWFGLAPMPEAQWKAKTLDAQDNIEEALAIIEQVVEVFKHLALPEIQGDIRDINNRLWAEIDVFQDACNAVRTTRGEAAPDHNLTKLWQEYIKCLFQAIEHQNRAWVFTHLKTLQMTWKTRFLATFTSGRQINSHQATVKIDHYAMMILNKIQDIYMEADIYVRKRTDGFITAERTMHPALSNIGDDKRLLNEAYRQIERERVETVRAAMKAAVDEGVARRRAALGEQPWFLEPPALLVNREIAHKNSQPEIENPLPREVEQWVAELRGSKVERFGFVVYRLSYKESEDKWKEFLGRLRDGLGSGWEGVVGAEEVRVKAKLYWVDGSKEGITEGDMEGARQHFKTLAASPDFPTGLAKQLCLAITPHSIPSFSINQPPEGSTEPQEASDFRGFVHVIDPAYDPNPSPPGNASSSNAASSQAANGKGKGKEKEKEKLKRYPIGYDGTFKIMDQLVWTDLYALHVMNTAQNLQEYWALAAEHPWGVYVGPTTGVWRREWRYLLGGIGLYLKEIVKEAFGM